MCDRLPRLSELSCRSRLPEGACQKGYDPCRTTIQMHLRPASPANGATAIDVGLRAFMLRVYNYMAAGVGLTGECRHNQHVCGAVDWNCRSLGERGRHRLRDG